ncbi:hypothetical protein M1E11_26210 (plasmid) [Bacillus sp. JZ8]
MENNLLSAGIYAIINKKLNTVYVGETQDSFLIRWIEHSFRILEFYSDQERMALYLDKDTRYIVLKELNPEQYTTKEFYKFEYEAMKFYKGKKWYVVSKHSYKENSRVKGYKLKNDNYERYKRAIKRMVKTLGLVNTKSNNIGFLYSQLYKKVNKHFETDVYKRPGKNVFETLTREELEFIMLDLYPRYYEKVLSIYRIEYQKQDTQLNLF